MRQLSDSLARVSGQHPDKPAVSARFRLPRQKHLVSTPAARHLSAHSEAGRGRVNEAMKKMVEMVFVERAGARLAFVNGLSLFEGVHG